MSNADREGAVKLDHKIECPFCGGLRLTRCEDDALIWTKCNDCGALGPVQHPGGDRITWNTRSIPTPPPAAEAGEREAFERWVNKKKYGLLYEWKHSNGVYEEMHVQLMWEAWQASRTSLLTTPSYQDGVEAALAAQPATAEDPNESTYQRGRFDGIMEYAAAILALKAPSTAGKETT